VTKFRDRQLLSIRLRRFWTTRSTDLEKERKYQIVDAPDCGTLPNRNRSRRAPLITDFGVNYYDSQTAERSSVAQAQGSEVY
jgi:hypothetical protein